MVGTLYVVATPIGNLGDVTRRAAEVLSSVDRVVAEDTRRTCALLTHLGIHGKSIALLDANARERAVSAVVERLLSGERIALVTDAGTPSVSDPGTELVRRAALREVPVVAVPGPSAVTAAVAVSGLVEGPFLFLGFLPRHGEKRRRALERIAASPDPVVLFEAPARVARTLTDLAKVIPDRAVCVARELTKLHEEVVRGTLEEIAARGVTERGEFTLVVAGGGVGPAPSLALGDIGRLIDERLQAGDSPRSATDHIAALSGAPRREIYARVLRAARRRAGDG